MARVRKAEFVLSDEVESAEWFNIEEARENLREATVARKLVENCIERICESSD